MGLLFLFISLAILLSFLCSILEASLLSVTPSYVENAERVGKRYAAPLRKIKENIDSPLIAILSLNTIAHTIGAAGVGAQVTSLYGDHYLAAASIVMTLLILFLSEIVPKSLGANYWRELTPFTVATVGFLVVALWPLVYISLYLTRFLSREKSGYSTSREEIAAMASLGHREGIFEDDELRIMHNLLRFRTLKVKSIMTPRTVIFAAPETMSIEELFQNSQFQRFSRIPVYEQNLDAISGYILKHDLLYAVATGKKESNLRDIRRDILITPENGSITLLFDQLIKEREHIAAVVDEFGGLAGIVTMEDLLETLLGLEIVDESDGNHDMQELARERWRIRARNMGILPEDFPATANTAAGEANGAAGRGR